MTPWCFSQWRLTTSKSLTTPLCRLRRSTKCIRISWIPTGCCWTASRLITTNTAAVCLKDLTLPQIIYQIECFIPTTTLLVFWTKATETSTNQTVLARWPSTNSWKTGKFFMWNDLNTFDFSLIIHLSHHLGWDSIKSRRNMLEYVVICCTGLEYVVIC